MKPPGRARRAWALVAAYLLAAGSTLLLQAANAGEATRDPPRPPEHGNAGTTIESARRDFEAVKSLRSTEGISGGELPRVGMPGISTGQPATSSPMPQVKPDPKRASSNWLVEAMEKRDTPSTRDGRATGWPLSERERTEDRESATTERRSGGDSANPERAPAVNPFARYLDQWMTAQDYALLKPALTRSTAMDSVQPPPNRGTGVAAPPLPSPAGATEVFQVPQTVEGRGQRGLATPAANPYLALENSLPGRPSPVGQLAQPVLPGVSSKSGTLLVKPPDASTLPPAPASRIPGFVKPDDDEKYFKPLKRF